MPKPFTITVFFSFIIFTSFSNTSLNLPDAKKHKMSNTILKFIPTKPVYVPDKTNQSKAKVLLTNIFKKGDIELITTDNIEFIDQGSTFESVFCNYCGKEINTQYWHDAMDGAHQDNFKDLSFNTPCCNKKTTLNDLQYHSPAGFAKFVISVSDPANEMKATDLAELENILQSKLRKIWAHY